MTNVDRSIYRKDAEPRFVNEENESLFKFEPTYFPLQISPKSLLYTTLNNDDKDHVPILELMFGIDEIEIDDSLLQLGFTEYDRRFLNFKRKRFLQDRKATYSVNKS